MKLKRSWVGVDLREEVTADIVEVGGWLVDWCGFGVAG